MSAPVLVPCFVCGKELPRAFPEMQMQPYGGVMCEARGNFGSRVFDPFVALGHLAFVICDECFEPKADRMRLVKVTKRRPTVSYLDAALAFEKESLEPDVCDA